VRGIGGLVRGINVNSLLNKRRTFYHGPVKDFVAAIFNTQKRAPSSHKVESSVSAKTCKVLFPTCLAPNKIIAFCW